jgi:exosortase H (IPTLxxWG-CTERM-specific)
MSPEPDPAAAEAPRDGALRRHWGSLRVALLFGFFIGALYALRMWGPVDRHVIQPFTHFVAVVSHWMFALFGFETSRDGTLVGMGEINLNIMEECNGVPAILIYVAAVLAHSARLVQKAIGIGIGLAAIFLVNQVRVISLFFAMKYWPGIFEALHVYVWQTVIIVFALLLWLYWAERFVRRAG